MGEGRIPAECVNSRTCGAKSGKGEAEATPEFRFHGATSGRRWR